MGKIDDVHDAENYCQADGHQGIDQSDQDTRGKRLQQDF